MELGYYWRYCIDFFLCSYMVPQLDLARNPHLDQTHFTLNFLASQGELLQQVELYNSITITLLNMHCMQIL